MEIDWKTPQTLFNELNKEFNFTLDVCALPWNTQCESFFSPSDNGLVQDWSGVCWCNPPFDKTQSLWVRKSWEQAQRGVTTVLLFPGNYHDTEWFHKYALNSSEIRYFRGRPKFLNPNGKETAMRTILLVFKPYCVGSPHVSSINRDGTQYKENQEHSPKEK